MCPAAHWAQNPLEIKRTPPQPRCRPDYPRLLVGVESRGWFGSQEHEACCREDTSTDCEVCIAPPYRRPAATKWPRDSVTPFTAGPGEDTAHRLEWLMHKGSNTYLTAAVTALVVAILFSLTAIFVRSVVAMDGKIAADGTALESRKSLP